MEKVPRIPSKSEVHARIRCKGEDNRLSSKKDELDKVWHAESRYLRKHRDRFVVDRRRSMGNVYNSQIEGIQPHMRIRRPRRDSDPEMINIFRRQEDRRKSVKVIESAVTEDVMRRLERKFQEALAQNGSDADEEGSDSDPDVIFVPGCDVVDPALGDRQPLDRGDARWAERSQTAERAGKRLELPTVVSKDSAADRQHATEIEVEFRVKELRFEDRDSSYGHGDGVAERDVELSDSLRGSESRKQTLTGPERIKEVPRRKRSYSDGNVSVSILQLHNKDTHPFNLAKLAAEASLKQSTDEDRSEGEVQKPRSRRSAGDECAANERDPHLDISVGGIPRDETYVIETDVTDVHSLARRRGVDVSFELRSHDATVSPPSTRRRHADAPFRSAGKPDSTTSPSLHRRRGDSSPRATEVSFSPSLRRRLAGPECNTPRRPPSESAATEANHSPSLTRRRGEQRDSTSPKQTRRSKEDKPKPIYQQTDAHTHTKPPAGGPPKRRPLRRSRSEAVDLSELTALREKDFPQLPRSTRRGSDSCQGLATAEFNSKPPKSWNSLMFGLALTQEEREDIARHKRMELVTSLRKRQEEVDSDVSRRIQSFLHRYDAV